MLPPKLTSPSQQFIGFLTAEISPREASTMNRSYIFPGHGLFKLVISGHVVTCSTSDTEKLHYTSLNMQYSLNIL